MDLDTLGWNPEHHRAFAIFAEQGLEPARVAAGYEGIYTLLWARGSWRAQAAGRLLYTAAAASDLPVAGDWVAARPPEGDGPALIDAVLPRRNLLSRKAAGRRSQEQALAANLDFVLVVVGLDADFNLPRTERYLTLAGAAGIPAVILLNKADLCPAVEERLRPMEAVAPGTAVLPVSAATGAGLEGLHPYLRPGLTLAVIGSSGAGKSTLINRLAGTRRPVRKARAGDGRGRHTTSAREMVRLAGGALLIDSPGLREVQLWAQEEDLAASFADVEELAAGCRFHDCAHLSEPGCAVQEAAAAGELDPRRLASYRKLQRELAQLAGRRGENVLQARKERGKRLARLAREAQRQKRRG